MIGDGAADAFGGVDVQTGPELAGTGFTGVGQTTGLYTILGPATPNAQLDLSFAIFDMGDDVLDTTVFGDVEIYQLEVSLP